MSTKKVRLGSVTKANVLAVIRRVDEGRSEAQFSRERSYVVGDMVQMDVNVTISKRDSKGSKG